MSSSYSVVFWLLLFHFSFFQKIWVFELIILNCGLIIEVTGRFLLRMYKEGSCQNLTFSLQKTSDIFFIVAQIMSKGYRCKSDHPPLKWRNTWNTVYSPFKLTYLLNSFYFANQESIYILCLSVCLLLRI